ncbi:MAG: phosphohistidine phosphatase SixA [Pirellulales bacterium]|nr:phosphohistidine phosphatase SixA [Pirellulales bacterium]
MILYIVRHAWAEDCDANRWPDDGLRPITKKGRKRFAKYLRRMDESDFAPQIVATSPLLRCRQTAEILVDHLPEQPSVVELEALAPGSDLPLLIQWTAAQEADEIAWVGHAPDVGRLAATLIGSENAAISFTKGAVACIQFDGPIAIGNGQLEWLATARLFGV